MIPETNRSEQTATHLFPSLDIPVESCDRVCEETVFSPEMDIVLLQLDFQAKQFGPSVIAHHAIQSVLNKIGRPFRGGSLMIYYAANACFISPTGPSGDFLTFLELVSMLMELPSTTGRTKLSTIKQKRLPTAIFSQSGSFRC